MKDFNKEEYFLRLYDGKKKKRYNYKIPKFITFKGENLKVFSLPISGGYFPDQIGSIMNYMEASKAYYTEFTTPSEYLPDLVLGCSGGCVAQTIMMAAAYNLDNVFRVCKYIDQDCFIESWMPRFMKDILGSQIMFLIEGRLFKKSDKAKNLLKEIFNPQTIQQSEFWILTYNSHKRMAKLFCNKSENNAIIKQQTPDFLLLTGSEEFSYLDGDVSLISDAVMASASIPALVEEEKIKGQLLSDGGSVYASPFIPLQNRIYDVILRRNLTLKMFYFPPHDFDKTVKSWLFNSDKPSKNPYISVLLQFFHSYNLVDRDSIFNLLQKLACGRRVKVKSYLEATVEIYTKVLEKFYSVKHAVILVYPENPESIDIVNFTGEDIIRCIEKDRQKYRIDLWYIS